MHKTGTYCYPSNIPYLSYSGALYYSTFGSLISTRSWSDPARDYRYGFNGKEKDFETANDDYDFGARIYDGRLGRWLSLDPLIKKYVSLSPYNFVGNGPIVSIDKDGREIINTYDKNSTDETERQNYIKVQTAIEIVKLTMPELYTQLQASPYKITIQIDNNLSEFVEPSVMDGFGGTTSYNSEEVNTDVIGKCYTANPVNIDSDKRVIVKLEDGKYVYYKRSLKVDDQGTAITEVNQETGKEEFVYEDTPITETEANDLLKMDENIQIKIDDGVASTNLLGKILTHELTHADYAINNKARLKGDVDNENETAKEESESKALESETEYSKNYKNSNEKQAKKNATQDN